MKTDLTATVIGGSLELDTPLALPDRSRVRVTVESLSETNDGWQTALRALDRLRRERLQVSLELGRRYSLSHWDSLVLAACLDAGIDSLYSEDMDSGTDYNGVHVIDPFA